MNPTHPPYKILGVGVLRYEVSDFGTFNYSIQQVRSVAAFDTEILDLQVYFPLYN